MKEKKMLTCEASPYLVYTVRKKFYTCQHLVFKELALLISPYIYIMHVC